MSNNRTGVTLSFFDISDLPALAHALMIARNTAMMSGKPVAAQRLQALQEQVSALIPDAVKVFDEADWCEILAAIYEGEEWSVDVRKPRGHDSFWVREGHICVEIGDKTWLSRARDHSLDTPVVDDLRALLEEIAPLPRYGCGR